jgi:hypothetical protein
VRYAASARLRKLESNLTLGDHLKYELVELLDSQDGFVRETFPRICGPVRPSMLAVRAVR